MTKTLRQQLAELEKQSFGSYCFEPGCVERGVDNAETPLRKALAKLET